MPSHVISPTEGLTIPIATKGDQSCEFGHRSGTTSRRQRPLRSARPGMGMVRNADMKAVMVMVAAALATFTITANSSAGAVAHPPRQSSAMRWHISAYCGKDISCAIVCEGILQGVGIGAGWFGEA